MLHSPFPLVSQCPRNPQYPYTKTSKEICYSAIYSYKFSQVSVYVLPSTKLRVVVYFIWRIAASPYRGYFVRRFLFLPGYRLLFLLLAMVMVANKLQIKSASVQATTCPDKVRLGNVNGINQVSGHTLLHYAKGKALHNVIWPVSKETELHYYLNCPWQGTPITKLHSLKNVIECVQSKNNFL